MEEPTPKSDIYHRGAPSPEPATTTSTHQPHPQRYSNTQFHSSYWKNWSVKVVGQKTQGIFPTFRKHDTDLGLSFWCLSRTRPLLSSAQVKVSSAVSSRPSCPLRSSSRPLVGLWTRWKVRRSGGLSGSFTCSSVSGSGAEPAMGTSSEPLTCRTGGWLLTGEKQRRRYEVVTL